MIDETEIHAWHFTGAHKRLGNGDGRIVTAGSSLSVSGQLALCSHGLHASKRIIDALKYAPGPYVWRVRMGGKIVIGDDKMVAAKRTALWGFDATDVLRKFARMCALDVIKKWDAPEVVIKFLRTGDESLRDAVQNLVRSATRSAAWAAAWDAASDATRSAAWAAAWDAASDATRSAAWAAAWDAARDAALVAAWDAQNTRLTRMITYCADKAALRAGENQ